MADFEALAEAIIECNAAKAGELTKDFADEIGADGWAPDAASAKDLAQKLC